MIERCSPPVESSRPDLLRLLSPVLAERMGLDFSRDRLRDLERGVVSAASELGFANPDECLRYLTLSTMTRTQIEILASHLTVGETYFYRDSKSLEALKMRVLPELTSARKGDERRIRIWSAGCATGEEPYSLAILLDAAFPELKDWSVTILGTDINPRFLEKARAGVYSEWSFRDTPQWVRGQYFRKTRKGYALQPRIREMATFQYHNLVEDLYPSLLNSTNAMDIIFCRNVLMYFSPSRARDVADHFHRSLIDGGWLVVSPVETSQTLFSRFEAVNADGVTLYRKGPTPIYCIPAPLAVQQPPAIEFAELKKKTSVSPKLRGITPLLPVVRPKVVEEVKEQSAYARALALYEKGCYAEVVELLLPLAKKSGGVPDIKAMALLARAFANQGRLADALHWCERAISSDKLNPGLYCLAATILQEQRLFEKASTLLKQAIYLDRKIVLAHFALANLTRQQGKAKESRKYFANALALLQSYGHDDVLPESDGMIAGRLIEIIERLMIDDG
jgi:chemotaxis protein methyltransferase CheR